MNKMRPKSKQIRKNKLTRVVTPWKMKKVRVVRKQENKIQRRLT